MRLSKNLWKITGAALVAFVMVAGVAPLGGSGGTAQAAEFKSFGVLAASNPGPSHRFGASVATDGKRCLIGAINAGSSGIVYAFRYDGTQWIEEQQLTSSDNMGRFGGAVAMDGELALIGASEVSQVYAFRHDGSAWVETEILTPPAGQVGWGLEIAMLGDRALIAGGNTVTGYRHDGTNWIVESQLVPAIATSNLGIGLSMFGDKALVGDPSLDTATGSAWIFRHDGSGWVEEQQLVASDASMFDNTGSSVALGQDMAIVGAYDDGGAIGAAYAFRFDGSTWTETQKITASDGAQGTRFGEDVAIEKDTLVVGAFGVDAAYELRFDGTSWNEVQKIVPESGAAGTFGRRIALADGLMLIGATDASSVQGRVSTYFRAACLTGGVNSANGQVVDVLYVEGSNGGADRQVEVADGSFVTVSMLRPPLGGNGRFVLHANPGTANPTTTSLLPFDVGTACFPFLLNNGAAPVIVANNVGKTSLVGSSHFFGSPIEDPDPAECDFRIYALSTGTTLTLQAIEIDPGSVSQKNASVTNGVVVHVL